MPELTVKVHRNDTNWLVFAGRDSVSTTSVNLHEINYGLNKYAKPVREVLQLPILNYAKEDAQLSAKIEVESERAGTTYVEQTP